MYTEMSRFPALFLVKTHCNYFSYLFQMDAGGFIIKVVIVTKTQNKQTPMIRLSLVESDSRVYLLTSLSIIVSLLQTLIYRVYDGRTRL